MKDYPSYIENILSSNMPGVDFNGACVISQNPLADYTVPCFKFAKVLRKSPVAIAQQLKPFFDNDATFESVSEVNGYLNFKLNKINQANEVISSVLGSENYGSSKLGNGKTICIDYSSINIAKPFHIGHLSTTVIGAALARIYSYLGYKVVSINHLGDWGTQFGKLISAYKRYGNEEAVIKGGVKELMKIYVKFHEEAEKDPSLNDEARAYFKAIEDGSEEEMKLYNFFKEITLSEVSKTYSALNVKFDSYAGESFYNDKMAPIINELKDKGLMTLSDGAYVVPLSDYNMPPCIILRSDGATLYATRDLAAAEYRYNTYDFEKCLYVVAYQQNLHFQQIFKVMELMEKPYADKVEHVSYGMVSLEGGVSLSTRHGNVVFLEDVIKTAIDKAKSIITEKNPNLADKDEIARKVGTGAVVFTPLVNNRIKDIVFSYDKVLSFEGESAPYIQYTYARANSVMEKAGDLSTYVVDNVNDTEFDLIMNIAQIPDVLLAVINKNEPSFLTRKLLDVAKAYNKFYFECPILNADENSKNFRLALTKCAMKVLKQGLELLGIEVPEKM